MSLPSSPKLIKGGLVVLDATTGAVAHVIALQYNPDSLTRSYQVQGAGGDGSVERAQPFRLKGPAIETIKVEAEIDATALAMLLDGIDLERVRRPAAWTPASRSIR